MMLRFAVIAVLALSACAPGPSTEVPQRLDIARDALPPMKAFVDAAAHRPVRSNAEIARDFIELEFRMESGRPVPMLTRFSGPITVGMTGTVPATAKADLAGLIGRLRSEAGLDIRSNESGASTITVEFLPRAQMQALVPQAACFVVPRVSSWAEYRRARHSGLVDWTTLDRRDRVAVFVPSDTSPQEVRDCLHEEIAQALGPLNDLYRLPDSVFNDDNFHTVLTGFDMLVLRVHYAPELHNGMTEGQVAARLPALLARLNPAGQYSGGPPAGPTPRAWISAIETALGGKTASGVRRAAALKALTIAQTEGWQDNRLAFSYFAVGRLSSASELGGAITAFSEAARIYRTLPATEVHAAHVDMQLAAFALASGQAEEVLRLTDRALPAVSAAKNAALLSTLLMLKAEALDLTGRASEAQVVRLDSLGWARYGFGSEAQVRARLSEIAALTPRIDRVAKQ